jgi:hypothetical protein
MLAGATVPAQLAGNGHVDQGRCPDIDAFLTVNLLSGCTPTKVKRKSTGSGNLRGGSNHCT